MAEKSPNDPDVKVWTFLLLSGPPIQITLPGNPPLDFQGRRTIWKIVSSRAIAEQAKNLLTLSGITVELYTESMNEDMIREQKKYRGEN